MATYVGTMYTSANGTSTWELGGSGAGGDPIRLYLWNCYHRRSVAAAVMDNTDSWTYNSTTPRSRDANTNNRASAIFGLAEDVVECSVPARGQSSTSGFIGVAGVGLDSTSSSTHDYRIDRHASISGSNQAHVSLASYARIPALGHHFWQALESCDGAETVTFYGDIGGSVSYPSMMFKGMF